MDRWAQGSVWVQMREFASTRVMNPHLSPAAGLAVDLGKIKGCTAPPFPITMGKLRKSSPHDH
jgi:hypothetical protein